MLERVHHIDFVVRDLEAAVERYTKILGRRPLERERLDDRGVELARFDVGGIWIILVQPVTAESPVQAFLDRYGEGFFHIAYRVEDVESEADRLRREGIDLGATGTRRGLEGWTLLDLPMEETAGVLTQLVEDDEDR